MIPERFRPVTPASKIEIYTDGSSSGNPGPGGWGAIIHTAGRTRELSGGYRRTTNNRMELLAAIRALESLPEAQKVDLYSDSKYLVDNVKAGRLDMWQARGWMHNKNRPVPNADLWQRLQSLLKKVPVTFHWVQGHSGHPENERANWLAVHAGQKKTLPPDKGYEKTGEKGPQQAGLFSLQAKLKQAELPKTPANRKINKAGQPCRKCGTPVEKMIPQRKWRPGQTYYYAYYFHCPNCGTNYFNDEARREIR